MPRVFAEAYRLCPELKAAIKIIDQLSDTRSHAAVFHDLLDWIVWQHHFPPNDDNPLTNYSEEERALFAQILKVIQEETKQRTNLWQEQKSSKGWYDPFGRLYECITSKNKSQHLGQYFTPRPVVDFMTQISMSELPEKEVRAMLDPACGSGRMGLAAATHSMKEGNACWVTMNDLDPICSKMTAANMCLNGIVGEALCMNGLDIKGESYRFGYRVEPMLAHIPPESQQLYRMMMLTQTGQDIQKQYTLRPISYEQSYLKQVNDHVLEELEQHQQIAEEEARQQAVDALKTKVQERLNGTLFEGDTTQMENITKSQNSSHQRKQQQKKQKPSDGQQSLF